VLLELTVAEQRCTAVMEVLRDGLAVVEVGRPLQGQPPGRPRLAAPLPDRRLDALADRSHRPDSCPHQMPADLEARLCELRRRHPHWGPTPPRLTSWG
jgi:hypothetical protein